MDEMAVHVHVTSVLHDTPLILQKKIAAKVAKFTKCLCIYLSTDPCTHYAISIQPNLASLPSSWRQFMSQSSTMPLSWGIATLLNRTPTD